MNNVFEFPPSDRPIDARTTEHQWSESEIDKIHSEAFRNLEPGICDCVSMAKIAFDRICDLKTDDRELVFAVAHTWELLAKLRRDYYAEYHNEKPGGLHTSSI